MYPDTDPAAVLVSFFFGMLLVDVCYLMCVGVPLCVSLCRICLLPVLMLHLGCVVFVDADGVFTTSLTAFAFWTFGANHLCWRQYTPVPDPPLRAAPEQRAPELQLQSSSSDTLRPWGCSAPAYELQLHRPRVASLQSKRLQSGELSGLRSLLLALCIPGVFGWLARLAVGRFWM